MKEKDLLSTMLGGQQLLVGVYWAGKVEAMNIRDSKTKTPRTAHVLRETVLTDTEAVVVTAWMPDDFNEASAGAWKPPFKRMERVVVVVKAVESFQGFKRYNGAIEKLET